jgi:FixJ family two-component response regulator
MFQTAELRSEIFIVDDDAIVRESLSAEFNRAGYQVAAFSEGMSFVSAARERSPACVVMDMFMPGPSGLEILKQLDPASYPAPICIVSGRADISLAIEAIRNGASDFIEKQMNAASIVERVGKAIEVWMRRQQMERTSEFQWRRFPGRDRLTRREIEVLTQIAAGATSKVAAEALGISSRTVEAHRWNIMKKLGAKNAAELVRIVLSDGSGARKPSRYHLPQAAGPCRLCLTQGVIPSKPSADQFISRGYDAGHGRPGDVCKPTQESANCRHSSSIPDRPDARRRGRALHLTRRSRCII